MRKFNNRTIEHLEKMIKKADLDTNWEKVLIMRLNGLTFEEIAHDMNLSRERVGQIEEKALNTLSHKVTFKDLLAE